jgi:hypothetical protein
MSSVQILRGVLNLGVRTHQTHIHSHVSQIFEFQYGPPFCIVAGLVRWTWYRVDFTDTRERERESDTNPCLPWPQVVCVIWRFPLNHWANPTWLRELIVLLRRTNKSRTCLSLRELWPRIQNRSYQAAKKHVIDVYSVSIGWGQYNDVNFMMKSSVWRILPFGSFIVVGAKWRAARESNRWAFI